MTPFTVQVTRLISGDVSWPLQLRCRSSSWFNDMCNSHAHTGYYRSARYLATIPHRFLFVPDARIMSMNGRPIPQEWTVEDGSIINENMVVVDVRWTEADFTIEEVE